MTFRYILVRFIVASLLSAMVFAAMALNILQPAQGLIDVQGYAVGRDFVNVWNGSRLAGRGDAVLLFDVGAYLASLREVFGDSFPFHNWSYPPHALVLFYVFGQLSYLPALALWSAGGTVLFIATVCAMLPAGRRAIGATLAALSPASLIDLGFGQNGHLTAALMLGGIGCLDRRPRVAGVMFGLLTIKPHLGVLIPLALIAIGAWRTIAWAAATAVVLIAMSIVMYGIEPWRLYAGVTFGVQSDILLQGQGLFVAMMPTVFQSAKPVVGAAAASALQAGVTLLAVVLTVAAFRRAQDGPTRALVLTSGTLLTLPYAFIYDMTMLAGATVAFLATRRSDEFPQTIALAPAWVAPVAVVPLALYGYPLGPLAIAAAVVVAVRAALHGRFDPALIRRSAAWSPEAARRTAGG